MTVTDFVVAFIFMAVATMTILVVGTLGAADLLHRPHRSKAGEPSPRSNPRRQAEGSRGPREFPSEAASARDADLVGAADATGVQPLLRQEAESPRGGPHVDHDDPHQGQAA